MTLRVERNLTVLVAALALLGCSPEDPRRQQAEQALQQADAALADGKEVASPIFKAGKDRAQPYLDDASAYARTWLPDLPTSGALSDQAAGWIESAAKDDERVEAWLARGEQTLPVAQDIGRTLNDAIERDFVVEPIYRPIVSDDGEMDLAALDASIAAMPRVEVIDGITVGFRRLMADDTQGREKEAAFLVLWRAERHLVGFVFRSRRKIRIDKLVTEAPRLVKLVNGVVK